MENEKQTIHKRKKGVPEQWQILSVLMAVYDFIAIHGAYFLALLARFGRVHELHPRNFVGCMGFKTRWPPRQKTRVPFHGSICGCPAEGAFPWGPCAVQVWCFGTE